MTLVAGDNAPDFTLPSEQNKLITLNDYRGKNIVLYFYPKDNTPGCTQEACDFRDQFENFTQKNTIIFGISKDTSAKHLKFIEKYALPFTLLADVKGDVCEKYGVINKKSLFGNTFLGIERSTFLIDKNGTIQAIWRKVKVKNHIDEVLNELN